MLPGLNVFNCLGNDDAFALAPAIRLTDVRLALFGPGESLEVTITAKSTFGILTHKEKKHNKGAKSLGVCKLTLREGTTSGGRCCSLGGKASACGSCSSPVNLCGRSHSSRGSGLSSAKTRRTNKCVFRESTYCEVFVCARLQQSK